MPIGTLVGPIIREFVKSQARNLYQVLRAQDRILDYTYRKTGLYNRGVVRGLKHGLAGGQIIGGTLKLGLAPDSPGNEFSEPVQKRRQRDTSRTPNQTRRRYPNRCPPRYKNRS